MAQPLTAQELTYLRSTGQRSRLYLAVFGNYQLVVSTTKKDATDVRNIPRGAWRPILNIGPHRMLFAGEVLQFDAKDSFKIVFDADGKQVGDANDQGYGKGAGIGTLDWQIEEVGGAVVANYEFGFQTTLFHQFNTPGLFLLKCKPADEPWETYPYARRWIRVHANREDQPYSVTEIRNLSGSWGSGWSCDMTIQTPDDVAIGTNLFGGYRAVGLYAEDEWWDEATQTWIRHPIGSCRQDPRLVLSGFVREASIVGDSVSRTISFTVDTIDIQMENSTAHKTAVWLGRGPKGKRKEFESPQGDPPPDPETVTDFGDNDVDNWGAILKGFKWVCTTDFVTYLLMFKTNLLLWHDYYALWNGKLAVSESISGEETSILSNLQTAAENDWLVTGADHSSAIIYGPDRQVTKDAGWTGQWAIRQIVEPTDAFVCKFDEKLVRDYKYVRLIAIKPRTGKQLVAEWPLEGDERKAAGAWYIKEGLVHDSKGVLQQRAADVYAYINLLWTGSWTCGLNRAIRCGDYIIINVTDGSASPPVGHDKEFIVSGISYDIDVAAGSWISNFELEDSIRE